MTRIRKSSDITEVNALGMRAFRMGEIGNDLDYPYPTLPVHGNRGYTGYQVDIRFLEIVYLACPPSFNNRHTWRMATEEEAAQMYVQADEKRVEVNYRPKVYCIEENVSRDRTAVEEREGRKFFIVAWGVEIKLVYDEVFEEKVSNWGLPTE